jgi:hypothetical protein
MALRGQVIYLIGLDVIDDFRELLGVGKVAIMEKKPGFGVMGIHIEVVDAAAIE